MTITVTAEIERGLIEQAGMMGTSPEALAIETLRQRFAPPSAAEESATEGSLVDFLGEFVGCLSSNENVSGVAQSSKHTGKPSDECTLRAHGSGGADSAAVPIIPGEDVLSTGRTQQQLENLGRLCQKLDPLPTAPISDGMTNRDHDRILYGG